MQEKIIKPHQSDADGIRQIRPLQLQIDSLAHLIVLSPTPQATIVFDLRQPISSQLKTIAIDDTELIFAVSLSNNSA